MPTAADSVSGFFRSQASRIAGGGALPREEDILRTWESVRAYRVSPRAAAAQVGALVRATDADLQTATYEAIKAHAPVISRAFRTRFLPYASKVLDNWPVLSGKSRRQVAVDLAMVDNIATAKIGSGAAYTFMIRWGVRKTPAGFRTGDSVWWSLVRVPGEVAARAIEADIGRGG